MSRGLKTLLLPAAFLLTFSAEECQSPDEVNERIAVQEDGSVEVAFLHTARDFSRILDSDPHPSLEGGWDSVHVGTLREGGQDSYYLHAWKRFPEGAELPESFAESGDPLWAWYVRFPTELTREVLGDTILFRFHRTYPAMPWNPTGLVSTLAQKMDAVDDELAAVLEGEKAALEEQWETSGLLAEAEENGDSATLRRYQREIRTHLEAGEPPLFERARQFIDEWMLFSMLNDLAFAIPVGEQVCRQAHPGRAAGVQDLLLETLGKPEAPGGLVWKILLEEFNLEPDPNVFPELVGEGSVSSDDYMEAQTHGMLARFRETILTECGLSGDGLIAFDRRFAWLTERYHMDDAEVRGQKFTVQLRMPGQLLETNADTLAGGIPEWEFGVGDLFEREIRLEATSRVVSRDR